MAYLIDTNVISEHTRPRPETRVLTWLRTVPVGDQYISVLTLGEIRKGIEQHVKEPRREQLRLWLETELTMMFGDRLLPISAEVADRWGRLRAEVGRSVPAIDSLIAATALHHDLRLVTRNERDYIFPGLTTVNPWRM